MIDPRPPEPMRTTRGASYDTEWQSREVLGIGVVSRPPKIERKQQEVHSRTHSRDPLSGSGGRLLFLPVIVGPVQVREA